MTIEHRPGTEIRRTLRVGSVAAHHFGGRGERVLIAHAAGFCAGAYAPLARQLRAEFDVWGVDLRGHGDSPAPADGDFAWEGMAHDVLAVAGALSADRLSADRLSAGPPRFFGHSLGGAAGLRAEALRPGTFSAMYVFEPAVLPGLPGVGAGSREMGALVRRRRAVFASRAEAATRLGVRPPFDTLCAEALVAFLRHGLAGPDTGPVTLKCAPDDEAAVYEAADKITVGQLAGVAAPVLVGLGERDGGPAALAAPTIAAALPDARLVRYPGLGHLGPFERPDDVARDAAAHFAASR